MPKKSTVDPSVLLAKEKAKKENRPTVRNPQDPNVERIDPRTGKTFCTKLSRNGKFLCRMFEIEGTGICRSHSPNADKLFPVTRQCAAQSTFSNKRCRRSAILGGTVCAWHGGSTKSVKAAAKRRLLEHVEPALGRLIDLSEQDMHPPTAFAATKEILTRTLGKSDGPEDGEGAANRPSIIIGIQVGGGPTQVTSSMVNTKLLGGGVSREDARDAEVLGEGDDEELDGD